MFTLSCPKPASFSCHFEFHLDSISKLLHTLRARVTSPNEMYGGVPYGTIFSSVFSFFSLFARLSGEQDQVLMLAEKSNKPFIAFMQTSCCSCHIQSAAPRPNKVPNKKHLKDQHPSAGVASSPSGCSPSPVESSHVSWGVEDPYCSAPITHFSNVSLHLARFVYETS